MIEVVIEIGGKQFDNIEKAFRDLGDKLEHILDDAGEVVAPELRAALQRVAQEIAKRHGNPWAGDVASSSPNLHVRSGEGLQSIKDSIIAKAGKGEELVAGSISAGSMAIHETGGTIRATRSQYLTIPLPAAMDSRGVPLRARARDWDNTFVAKSKNGNLLIFRRLPGANKVTPLYLLKTEVYIPPRLGLETTITDTGLPYFEQKTLEAISKLLEGL